MARLILVSIALISMLSTSLLYAVEQPKKPSPQVLTQQRAKHAEALLAKAVDYYTAQKEKALLAFNQQGDFVDGDLYVVALAMDGTVLAGARDTSMFVGRNVSQWKDPTGKLFVAELLGKAWLDSSGRVEFLWFNKTDQKIERRVTYFQKVDNIVLAVGFYIAKASPEQAAALLEEAVQAVKTDPSAAIASFNNFNSASVQNDLYVYVIDLKTNTIAANGAIPALVNKNAFDWKDKNGKPFIKEMITIANEKGRGTIEYQCINPVTRLVETKHALFQKANNYIVAVGYYTR